MTETKHTPGLYEVRLFTSDTNVGDGTIWDVVAKHDDGTIPIAECRDFGIFSGFDNAVHIAQALNEHPDLLAENERLRGALEMITRFLERERDRMGGIDKMPAIEDQLIAKARAALEKGA